MYLDAENATEFLDYFEDAKKRGKFDYIINRILTQQNIYYEGYQKIINYESLSEMRLFPNGLNARIYCKEISTERGHFYVVVIKLLEKKKSQKIDKKITHSLKAIEDYEYKF